MFMCEGCKQRTKFGRRTCEHCGVELPELMQGTQREAPRRSMPGLSDKARARNAKAKAGAKPRSTPRPAPIVGRLEVRAAGLFLTPVGSAAQQVSRVDSDVEPYALAGTLLQWSVSEKDGDVVARPLPCKALDALAEWQRLYKSTRSTELKMADLLGPRPPGSTKVEQLDDPFDQIERLRWLATQKDDRVAWSELANAARIPLLRKPALEGVRQVGWEKVDAIVALTGDRGWDPSLLELLARERAKPKSSSNTAAIKHAFQHEEYGANPGD